MSDNTKCKNYEFMLIILKTVILLKSYPFIYKKKQNYDFYFNEIKIKNVACE